MPQTILGEHVAILDAVIAGRGAAAEALSRDHVLRAANIFVQRLQAQQAASEEESASAALVAFSVNGLRAPSVQPKFIAHTNPR